jgi:hypothetical protein
MKLNEEGMVVAYLHPCHFLHIAPILASGTHPTPDYVLTHVINVLRKTCLLLFAFRPSNARRYLRMHTLVSGA